MRHETVPPLRPRPRPLPFETTRGLVHAALFKLQIH